MNALLQGLQELLPGTPMLRSLAKFAAMVILFSILLLILSDPYITNPAGKILVIYDSDDNDSPSMQGLLGVSAASPTKAPNFDYVPVKLNNQENPYSQLAQSTVNVPILGVISTLTSPNSMPIVRFFRTLRVPLVVAVAANDDLLEKGNGTEGLVFRIVPTNSTQAWNIYEWLRTTGELAMKLPKDVPRHIAIFYEGNSFGTFLHQEFLRRLHPQNKEDNQGKTPEIITYNYPVNEHTEFSTLLPELRCDHTDLIALLRILPPQRGITQQIEVLSTAEEECEGLRA